MSKRLLAIGITLSLVLLFGWGGTKVLKESQPMQITQPLGLTSFQIEWLLASPSPPFGYTRCQSQLLPLVMHL